MFCVYSFCLYISSLRIRKETRIEPVGNGLLKLRVLKNHSLCRRRDGEFNLGSPLVTAVCLCNRRNGICACGKCGKIRGVGFVRQCGKQCAVYIYLYALNAAFCLGCECERRIAAEINPRTAVHSVKRYRCFGWLGGVIYVFRHRLGVSYAEGALCRRVKMRVVADVAAALGTYRIAIANFFCKARYHIFVKVYAQSLFFRSVGKIGNLADEYRQFRISEICSDIRNKLCESLHICLGRCGYVAASLMPYDALQVAALRRDLSTAHRLLI